MITRFRLLFLIIMVLLAGCQQTSVTVEPTPEPAQAVVAQLPPPTQTPRPVMIQTVSPSSTAHPASPATDVPAAATDVLPVLSVTPITTRLAILPTLTSVTTDPASTPTGTAVPTRGPTGSTLVIGRSAQGREILGWRLGTGEKLLLLVGGVHAGFESNTVMLLNELVAHFEGTPADVLPGITLLLIPVLNPDGLALGRQTAGRFNSNGVDLNRNWACGWKPDAYWQDRQVDPGLRAFSEPETQALALLIRNLRPAAAVFYHSAATGVFAGDCEGGHGSETLAAVLGEAADYPYGKPFSAYAVTGTAPSWVDGQGIPAVDVELSGTRDSEFVRNLGGVLAVQCWLVGNPAHPVC